MNVYVKNEDYSTAQWNLTTVLERIVNKGKRIKQ